MDIMDLLNIGRDSNESLQVLMEVGTFSMEDADVKRLENDKYGSHAITFPLVVTSPSGEVIRRVKIAKLRSSASIDAPKYRIYVAKLTADYLDASGNLRKNKEGKIVGKKGDMDYYAESIGGTPRVKSLLPLNGDAPFGE